MTAVVEASVILLLLGPSGFVARVVATAKPVSPQARFVAREKAAVIPPFGFVVAVTPPAGFVARDEPAAKPICGLCPLLLFF